MVRLVKRMLSTSVIVRPKRLVKTSPTSRSSQNLPRQGLGRSIAPRLTIGYPVVPPLTACDRGAPPPLAPDQVLRCRFDGRAGCRRLLAQTLIESIHFRTCARIEDVGDRFAHTGGVENALTGEQLFLNCYEAVEARLNRNKQGHGASDRVGAVVIV